MMFKPKLLEYKIVHEPGQNKWGVVVLYKDGSYEFSCSSIVENGTTWGQLISNFLPRLVLHIQDNVERHGDLHDQTNREEASIAS